MEACGPAHHWARSLNRLSIEVKLLPAAYGRAYVRRNKTDATDACALVGSSPLRRQRAGASEVAGTAILARAASGSFAME